MDHCSNESKRLDGLSLLSLMLGFITLGSVWCCIGYPIGIVAIVLGFIAISRFKRGIYTDGSKVLAIAGIATSFAAIGIHMLLMAVGMVSPSTLTSSDTSGNSNRSSTHNNAETVVQERYVPVPTPVAPEKPIKETCYQLSHKFGASSSLSDLQKEELWKDYQGRTFEWSLEVTEVSSDLFGGFTVQYKCSPKSSSFIQDIQIKYPDSRKQYVMQFSKGRSYTVKGRLGMSSALLGMTADDVQ